jgi:hypothetical protein
MITRPCPSIALSAFALSLVTARLPAQSEAALKQHFEGKTVTMKLAMPGTEDGVDIYPMADPPLDYPRYADRLKGYGTAIKSGESVMITKIKVKSKLIEFQLGGGGYGTSGDETSSSVSVSSAPKTKREKNLEAELKRETDPNKQREMKEEIDKLREERGCTEQGFGGGCRGTKEAEHPAAADRGWLAFQPSVQGGSPILRAHARGGEAGTRGVHLIRRHAGRPDATPTRWQRDGATPDGPSPKGNAHGRGG